MLPLRTPLSLRERYFQIVFDNKNEFCGYLSKTERLKFKRGCHSVRDQSETRIEILIRSVFSDLSLGVIICIYATGVFMPSLVTLQGVAGRASVGGEVSP